MGIKVEFVVINWDNKFIELNSGTIDCIWNGMTVSDSVKKNCDISDAYAGNSQVVVMKKDALSKYKDKDAVKAANLTIAVEKALQVKQRQRSFQIMLFLFQPSQMHLKRLSRARQTLVLLIQQWLIQ